MQNMQLALADLRKDVAALETRIAAEETRRKIARFAPWMHSTRHPKKTSRHVN